MGRLLLILFMVFTTQQISAGSCCGQSPTNFTVLSLEQQLSVTSSYSYSQTQGRVLNTDDFYVWDDKEREVQGLSFNIASAFLSRHQIFTTMSLLKGSYNDDLSSDSSQHLSDLQLGYTYEALPEYSFSYWKPVVYVSLLVNAPTGRSIYDKSELNEGAGVTGHNQWAYGLGLTVKKVYHPLTLTLQMKSMMVQSKKFDSVKVSSFFDNSAALLFSYLFSFKDLSLNLGLSFNEMTQRKIKPVDIRSDSMRSTSVLLGLSRPLGRFFGAGINYSDQTLLGRPRNTLLNRTLTFNINYNYL